jgi:hypothetical protein
LAYPWPDCHKNINSNASPDFHLLTKARPREPDAAFSNYGFGIHEFAIPPPEAVLNRPFAPSAMTRRVWAMGGDGRFFVRNSGSTSTGFRAIERESRAPVLPQKLPQMSPVCRRQNPEKQTEVVTCLLSNSYVDVFW